MKDDRTRSSIRFAVPILCRSPCLGTSVNISGDYSIMEKNVPKETAGHLSLFPTLFLNLSDFMPSLRLKCLRPYSLLR